MFLPKYSLVLALVFVSLTTFAEDRTVGLHSTWAPSYRGFDVSGSVPFGEDQDNTFGLTYQHTNSDQDSVSSTTNQISADIEHELDTDQESSIYGGLSYWKNSESFTQYIGPSAGYRIRLEDADENEILTSAFSSDLFFYRADVETTASGTTTRRGTLLRPKTASLKLTQFHPSLEIERTFFDFLTPFFSAGYYFYNISPSQIENATARRAQRYTPATRGQLNEWVGGFLKKNWDIGARFSLPLEFNLSLSFGRDQSATDDSWSSTWSTRLTKELLDDFTVEFGVSHVAQETLRTFYYTAGLTYSF